MNIAIHIENLTKSYKNFKVLNGIGFDVKQGEIFGLLGVNGAGKTTALECIEGLRSYDEGAININGSIGIQLQSESLQSYIKPFEALNLFAKWNKTNVDNELVEYLGISEFSRKKYSNLSTGQKRRLHLALALTGNPDIIFLDEPTAGLDVEGKRYLHQIIRELKNKGKTIILASHDMTEVEQLCERIAILKNGNIEFIGTVNELTDTFGRFYNLNIVTEQGKEIIVTENLEETLMSVILNCRANGDKLLDVNTGRGSLEEHFVNIAKGDKR